ncbi:MAG: hypothetical protein WD749_06165 [Phycisphaerales bacterium]
MQPTARDAFTVLGPIIQDAEGALETREDKATRVRLKVPDHGEIAFER